MEITLSCCVVSYPTSLDSATNMNPNNDDKDRNKVGLLSNDPDAKTIAAATFAQRKTEEETAIVPLKHHPRTSKFPAIPANSPTERRRERALWPYRNAFQ